MFELFLYCESFFIDFSIYCLDLDLSVLLAWFSLFKLYIAFSLWSCWSFELKLSILIVLDSCKKSEDYFNLSFSQWSFHTFKLDFFIGGFFDKIWVVKKFQEVRALHERCVVRITYRRVYFKDLKKLLLLVSEDFEWVWW